MSSNRKSHSIEKFFNLNFAFPDLLITGLALSKPFHIIQNGIKKMKNYLIVKITIIAFVLILVTGFLSTGTNFKTDKDEMISNYQAGGTDWKAPVFADKLKNPLADDAKATKDGKNLFNTNCSSCHGDKGEGNGPAAAAINPKPKNLSSKQVQEQSDGALFWKITTGKPPMVSWKSALSEKQRWSLVNYVRQLKKK